VDAVPRPRPATATGVGPNMGATGEIYTADPKFGAAFAPRAQLSPVPGDM